ncbi:hypothetical protein DL763_004590 [Monosporascus cannonballus]|nr:hypothetical protein DL763_004590 [Monosporascus cannonballus]
MRPLSRACIAVLLPASIAARGRAVDLGWYPPRKTDINNLTAALNSEGVYGFIFSTSETPDDLYGTYNWCNMPHVRKTEYVKAPGQYELQYVEIIQRHHKRTPYASNAFPVEPYRWDCDDQGLFYYGQPLSDGGRQAAEGYWRGFAPAANPFAPSGWVGTCSFPQITTGGLDDSWTHGEDLYGVYHDLLGFLPGRGGDWRGKVAYRVTNNVITSQVAGMLVGGTWGTADRIPLLIQAAGVDSLEPRYGCRAGSALLGDIRSGPGWREHLDRGAGLFAALDGVSGVPPGDAGFHASFDRYFDNLSARQCHAKPLPCRLVGGRNSTDCVGQALADAVYRMGQWEYSHIYRDAGEASLAASVASYGVWVAELGAHLRDAMAGKEGAPIYVHNIAHDGSTSRLLSILQVDVMVWPGMGTEIVFELYTKRGEVETHENEKTAQSGRHYVRVLFGGRTLRSSNPSLGLIDMLPVETLLAYFDGLVGKGASLVKGKCDGSIPL